MKDKRIYTAWDNRGDEIRLFRGLEALVRHGVKPDHVCVYILVGYDHETKAARPELTPDDFHRRDRLRAFGARPYPMPFIRTPELVGFQRWCVRRDDFNMSWAEFRRARYQPRNVRPAGPMPLFDI